MIGYGNSRTDALGVLGLVSVKSALYKAFITIGHEPRKD
jgi:hypothetical protein